MKLEHRIERERKRKKYGRVVHFAVGPCQQLQAAALGRIRMYLCSREQRFALRIQAFGSGCCETWTEKRKLGATMGLVLQANAALQ